MFLMGHVLDVIEAATQRPFLDATSRSRCSLPLSSHPPSASLPMAVTCTRNYIRTINFSFQTFSGVARQ
jgi:hypothetical protein